MKIHPTAVIDAQAELGAGVEVGPYAVIEGQVYLGEDCVVGSHAVLHGPISFGCRNRIGSHAVLGSPPQDLKYQGEKTQLQIGDENWFREFASVHRGTIQGKGRTAIGSRNLIMAYAHVAHDTLVGDGCVLSNGATLAGHVEVHDGAIIGGLSGIHQFVRIGRSAFVGGCSAVDRDVIPFGLALGNRARLRHYNSTGLRRQGFSVESVERIRGVFRVLLDRNLNLAQAMLEVEQRFDGSETQEILAFIKGSLRGILRGQRRVNRAP